MQASAARYDGALIDLTIGDKGSYACLTLGALTTHEDDARRAVKVALALQAGAGQFPFLAPLQIGLTHGTLRIGAYGGVTRRTYGVLGDEVNLAARLMMTAAAGEILVSSPVYQAVEKYFSAEPRAPLPMKGKADPLAVFAVQGERKERAVRLQEPRYALPMVGRTAELQTITEKLALAAAGQSQIIGVVAEAGLGKSRLVAEVIRRARQQGFVGYGGACQSDALNTPYQAWKSIWQAFFEVDHEMSLKKQIRFIESEIEDRAPDRVPAMPLLNVVLELARPDNDFTKTLEPQHRKSALRALLEDCLRAAAQEEPLLLVVEDVHWIDALSHDLLEELARGLSDSRLCFVLAYRPPQLTRLAAPRLEALPNFTKIELHELTTAEAEQTIRAKLAQLYPARGGALPTGLVEKLMARAQGNPFYLEELLNYVRDRGLDPADLNRIELPDSLHALILSRIDQLNEQEKNTLRVASIVGRLFRAEWLTGYYPALGTVPRVQADLEHLAQLDITPLDTPEAELAYLFKHIVTHEVTYESLPFATRAKLHEQLARYLETIGAAADTIAFHYGRSDNTAKQREYYQKAAEAAQAVSAYITAVEYLTRLLDLTPPADPAFCALALQLAAAHNGLGDFPAARAAIAQAQAAGTSDADRASARVLLGEVANAAGDYAEAQTWLTEAVSLTRASNNALTLCRALAGLCTVYLRQSKLNDAQMALDECLALARALGDLTYELSALNTLATMLVIQGDKNEAKRFFSEIHRRAVMAGNRNRALGALNNLGVVEIDHEDYAAAREHLQQALALAREIGAQPAIALALINLAEVEIALGQLAAARAGLREGLALAQRIGTLAWVVLAVRNFGYLAHAEGHTARALVLFGLARQHPTWSSDNQYYLNKTLTTWALDPAVVAAGLTQGAALDWAATVQELLQA